MLLLLGVAGAVFFSGGGFAAGFLMAVGAVIVLLGASRADDRVAEEREGSRVRPESEDASFTVKAALPYAGIPSGINRLIIPDVGVVNWSDTPIELRFTLLAADGSGPLESVVTSSRTVSAGTQVLSNPMRLEPRSSCNGRLIWVHGGGDVTQYVAPGVVLRVLEEQSGVCVDIARSTAGYVYPPPKQNS